MKVPNLRTGRTGNSGKKFFYMLCWDILLHVMRGRYGEQTCNFVIYISEIMSQIMYLKWALGICKTCQFIILHGNIKLSILSSLEYWYRILFVHNILCPQKGCFLHDQNVHKVFSAMHLTIICVNLFTFNNTTVVFKRNTISPLNIFF